MSWKSSALILSDEFVSDGSKICAFSVFFPSTVKLATNSKVTGITLTYENSKVVKFTTLRNMIREGASPVHIHNPRNIKRKHFVVVASKPETKEYKFAFKNRCLTYNSPPYGY